MSRGGGGRGGRGGGRGGFGGANNPPPMGLTFADLQNLSREATELYPVCCRIPLLWNNSFIDLEFSGIQPMRVPVFTEPSDEEKKIAELQLGIAARLRTSQYYIVEKTKSTGKDMLVQRFRS